MMVPMPKSARATSIEVRRPNTLDRAAIIGWNTADARTKDDPNQDVSMLFDVKAAPIVYVLHVSQTGHRIKEGYRTDRQ